MVFWFAAENPKRKSLFQFMGYPFLVRIMKVRIFITSNKLKEIPQIFNVSSSNFSAKISVQTCIIDYQNS